MLFAICKIDFIYAFIIRKYWKLSIWAKCPEWVGYCSPSLHVKSSSLISHFTLYWQCYCQTLGDRLWNMTKLLSVFNWSALTLFRHFQHLNLCWCYVWTPVSSVQRTVPGWAIVWLSITWLTLTMPRWKWCVVDDTRGVTTVVCHSTRLLTISAMFQITSTGDFTVLQSAVLANTAIIQACNLC